MRSAEQCKGLLFVLINIHSVVNHMDFWLALDRLAVFLDPVDDRSQNRVRYRQIALVVIAVGVMQFLLDPGQPAVDQRSRLSNEGLGQISVRLELSECFRDSQA